MSEAIGDIDNLRTSLERNGDGKQEIGKRGFFSGGLSTTPSSMRLPEKSMVELSVGAEQRKFPVLRISYCP